MALIEKRSAIINGTPWIHALGVNAGTSLGNLGKLTYNCNIEKLTVANLEGGGGNADVYYRFKDGQISLECKQLSIDLFLLAFGGIAQSVAAGAVADEAHTVVALDKLIMIDHLQDMSVALTVESSDGVTTYTEGTHYIRKRGGIIPLADAAGAALVGGIKAGDTLNISYTKHKHQRVQALMNTITERGLYFDGRNERTGAPWAARFHRLGFSPSKTFEFIGDQFMSFTLEGEMLAWDGITDPTKSPFLEMLVGDL